MERRLQYYVPFTSHTQYNLHSTRSREHNNTMQKLILNYTRLHEHTHLIHSCPFNSNYSCVRIYIYIEDMRTKKWIECAVTSERSVFVV